MRDMPIPVRKREWNVTKAEAMGQGWTYDEYLAMNPHKREHEIDEAWWKRTRREMLDDAGGRCQGKDHKIHCPPQYLDNVLILRSKDKQHRFALDHIVPTAPFFGGKRFDKTNLQILCWYCHEVKTAYEIALWREANGGNAAATKTKFWKFGTEASKARRDRAREKEYAHLAGERNAFDALLDSMGT